MQHSDRCLTDKDLTAEDRRRIAERKANRSGARYWSAAGSRRIKQIEMSKKQRG